MSLISKNQTILLAIDLWEFNTKPEKCEQMAILSCVPIWDRESLISIWKLLLLKGRSRFQPFFLSLLITLQCLHLSVCQPELMELSADRQTACCQLCSVQPDNTAQCISSSEMDDWTARLYCRVEVFICASARVCSLVRIFAHFCVCLSICGLFPLLTTEINMLSNKSKQNRWRHIENIYKEHQY